MKKDNVIKRVINSMYDIKKMAVYSREGLGRTIIYALLFCALLGILKATVILINMNSYINEIETLLREDRYEFNIKNNELSIENSPIKNEIDNILLYVDDEKSLEDTKDLKKLTVNSEVYFLILKDGIIANSNSSDYPLGEVKKTYSELAINKISNDSLISALGFAKVFLIIGTFFSSILLSFLYYLFEAVFMGVFILLISSIYRVNLKYSEAYSVAIYTSALPNVVIFIFNIFVPTVYFSLASMVGTMLISLLVIREIGRNKIEKVI